MSPKWPMVTRMLVLGRQCGEATLRTLVTPGSEMRPFRAKAGEGMPQRAIVSSRTPSGAVRTIGADVVGEYARQRWHIARVVAHRPGEIANGLLALGDRIEIAHGSYDGARAAESRWASVRL
jgi:hypothetical protein